MIMRLHDDDDDDNPLEPFFCIKCSLIYLHRCLLSNERERKRKEEKEEEKREREKKECCRSSVDEMKIRSLSSLLLLFFS